jgi:pimeloyl-ACP methyl ester carboxylesterase
MQRELSAPQKEAGGSTGAPAPPFPAEECFIEIAGARMRYLRAGSGPPLILLHGLLGYSFSWRFTLPALAPYATVYAPDMLGAGFSDFPPDLDCGLSGHAERLLKFLNVLGIESFDLLGTSHGGAVAMIAAAMCAGQGNSHPHLRRLILSAPVNPWSERGKWLAPFFGTSGGSWLFRLTLARWRFLQGYWLRRLYGDASRIPPGTLAGYQAPFTDFARFNYGLSIVSHWSADLRKLETLLPEIAGFPTLLLWGSLDRAVDIRSAEPLRRVFRNCELGVFEGAGHLPYEEVPEEFSRALIRFLTRR